MRALLLSAICATWQYVEEIDRNWEYDMSTRQLYSFSAEPLLDGIGGTSSSERLICILWSLSKPGVVGRDELIAVDEAAVTVEMS